VNKLRLYWSLQIGGWLTFAILQTIGYHLLNEEGITSYIQVLFYILEALALLLITNLFRTILIRSGWLGLGFRRLIPRVAASVLVIGIIFYVLRVLIAVPLGVYTADVAFDPSLILGLIFVYSLIALIWCVFYLIYHYFERYNLTLKRQAEMNEIELENLKSQLNPHFIFNALNSIRALVDEDPKKSKHAITQLSMILRSTLVSDQNSLSKFDDEMRTVENYLGLESIRYEERLQVKLDIDPQSFKFHVPPLMLQTIVENGIKHGISQLKEGGQIGIETKVIDDRLRIMIRNSGQMKKRNGHNGKNKNGLGLINTKRRLALIYGDDASFDMRNETGRTVCTELVLPLNRKMNESADNRR